MSIIAGELRLYKSSVVNHTTANGGKLSTTEVITAIKNNTFSDVSQADRLAGVVRYRKVFAKLTNIANEILFNPKYHLKTFTPGEDYVEMFLGTQIDTQVDIIGTERKYGSGSLKTNVSAGATEFICTLEDSTQNIFETTNNTIFISDGTNEEYFTNVSASKTGADVTLTVDTGFALLNDYLASNTSVASVIFTDATTLIPTFESVIATTAGDGDYNDTTNPLEGDNNGGIEEVFTLTFTSATEYTCVGAFVGEVGSGNITSDFSPINTDFSKPYFILRLGGWSGSWVSGDTLEIQTHPAACPLWLKQTVPAGCASYSGNNFSIRFAGESA